MSAVKAVGLLSGGLDSILAVKLICDQNIDVYALHFILPFCPSKSEECTKRVKRIAKNLSVPLELFALGKDYIEIIKQPHHGYGKNMNPCIDCRVFTLTKAKQYMEEIGASFVFTGEVLGERPMSQNLRSLQLVEKESCLTGKLLRPLSAKLLKPTIPEKQGLIDREKLLAAQGRSRKTQLNLAQEWGITGYAAPAGGCLLTDASFAVKLKESFAHHEGNIKSIQLLSYGRHFRLPSGSKIVIGRNEKENAVLLKFIAKHDYMLEVIGYPGPIALLKKSHAPEDIKIAAALCARYSDGIGTLEVKVKRNNEENIVTTSSLSDTQLKKYRIG